MPGSFNIATRLWQAGATASRTFDSPPAQSIGYQATLGDRAGWPVGPCVQLTVELSFDDQATWHEDSVTEFGGGPSTKGGAPRIAGEWPTVVVDGVPTIKRPTHVRVSALVLQAFTASFSAGWVV